MRNIVSEILGPNYFLVHQDAVLPAILLIILNELAMLKAPVTVFEISRLQNFILTLKKGHNLSKGAISFFFFESIKILFTKDFIELTRLPGPIAVQ